MASAIQKLFFNKPLGEGGAGRVYRATDDAGKAYAIKLLDPAKATSEKRKRFKNEVEFGRRNRHQHIIAVIDDGVYIDGNKHAPFYVMPVLATSYIHSKKRRLWSPIFRFLVTFLERMYEVANTRFESPSLSLKERVINQIVLSSSVLKAALKK